jgi:DNA repair photolyase
MIISASRRTDIPAFYAEWFMNRIRAGFVLVHNPFNIRQVRRVSLAVPDVDALVFWTRDAKHLLHYLPELDTRGYRYYFQYTITGYPKMFERSVPDLNQALNTFRKLSDIVGPQRVLWRYDPILLSNLYGLEQHLNRFAEIASALRGKTRRVTISIADFYRKTLKNLSHIDGLAITDISKDRVLLQDLIGNLARIAEDNGLKMQTCTTQVGLSDSGIRQGKCIDDRLLKDVFGRDYPAQKDKGQRPGCTCVKSIDIGQYSTCLHGCLYCYATSDQRQAMNNWSRHDPAAPVLIGPSPASDIICRPFQPRLF